MVSRIPTSATAFVPVGVSVWELGAQRQRIERKAEEDYVKRTAEPLGVIPANTTYMFVTPHRWPHKDEWAAAKRAEGIWKDVRVLDGDSPSPLARIACGCGRVVRGPDWAPASLGFAICQRSGMSGRLDEASADARDRQC